MAEDRSFYILTDTHYVSKKIFTDGKAFRRREKGDQIALRNSAEILRSFFDIILEDEKTDAVLITGDLVNSGDRVSHEDFISELKTLTNAGKRVFVTTATHDYCGMGDDENFFTAVKYFDDHTEPALCVRKSELNSLYYDFGPRQSDSVHEESGSYSLKLFEGVRLIAINDNGNGRSHCGLFDDGFMWLENEIDNAGKNGEEVLLAVHHPVIPPWDIYARAAEFEMFGGYKRISELMCKKGVRVIFTGHTHVQNIRKFTDEQGRYFYDVSTSAAVSAAGCMRKVNLDISKKICDIKSVRINSISGVDTEGQSVFDYIYHLNFTGALEKALPLAKSDFNAFLNGVEGVLPADKLKAHPVIVKTAVKKAEKLKLSSLAKFGKKYNGLSREEISALNGKKALPVLFEIAKHIFAGNAPYSPDTAEYKILYGVVKRAEKIAKTLHISAIDNFIPAGETLWDIAQPFICNNRTGDDDAVTIKLSD
ncbi:MAG: metallophosphoesterase [Oscillospiraceae bacterium]|nr:metallophosphoesterase [Oscillospiraceae bacterium]